MQLARRRISPASVLMLLLIGAIGFLVLYPIGSVLVNGLIPGAGTGGRSVAAVWHAAFAQPGLAKSILNTLAVVALTEAIAFPVAIVIAWVLARTDIPGSSWLEFGFWLLFFLPALGTTTGWLILFDPNYGLANKLVIDLHLFAKPPFNMFSYGGIVFAHISTYSVAVLVMLLTPAFRNLDGSIEEAARVCGAGSLRALWNIVLPLVAPALAVAFLMSLMRSLESFEIELFLGLPAQFSVYSTKIYQLLRGDPPDYASATVLATLVLLVVIPLIIMQRWISTRRSYATIGSHYRRTVRPLGRWRLPLFGVLFVAITGMSLLPLALQLAGSFMTLFGFFGLSSVWTTAHWSAAFSDPRLVTSLTNSLLLGTGTAIGAVVIYTIVAYCAVRLRGRLGSILDTVTWLPLTLPGIILGFGYLRMVLQVPVFSPFYGSLAILMLICWVTSITLGVQVLKANMLQISPELEEAARIVGAPQGRTFRDIVIPLALPAIVVVGVMVFSQTLRQVSTIVLMSSGNTAPLSLLQLEYLSAGMLGPASVCGTLIVLMSVIAAAIVRIVTLRSRIRLR